MEERPKISLKFWESATESDNPGELTKLAGIGDKWWDKIHGWMSWLGLQIDVEFAPLQLVNLLAWQRDIDRLSSEPEELYRKRVKYALANAKDAGYKAGFVRIWKRLGLGKVEQDERIDGQDWDIINLTIDEETFGQYPELLEEIITKYGRTCRRYTLATKTDFSIYARAIDVNVDIENITATGLPVLNASNGIRIIDHEIYAENMVTA